MIRHHFIAIACTASAACAHQEAAFEPTENVAAAGHAGQPAAAYEVRTTGGRVAHVNVWSDSARVDDHGRTVVQLTLEVRNVDQQPIQLARDLFRLEAFTRSGAPLPGSTLLGMRSEEGVSDVVPPAGAATVHLYFALPRDTKPKELGSLRLRWALAHADGRRYVQFTEFRRAPEPRYATAVMAYTPVWGFYDPFIYGPPVVYYRYHVPVGRVIIDHRHRSRAGARR